MEVVRLGRRLVGLTRFAFQARGIRNSPITIEEAQQAIQDGVKNRGQRFLAKLARSVYGYPRSPYRKLLECAGCELGDVRRLVETDGLDEALGRLATAGVSLTYEEFKGRAPVVRGSRTFSFEPSDFDDPLMAADTFAATGGTRGKAVPRRNSSETIYQFTPHWAVFLAENDCLQKPLSFWTLEPSAPARRQLTCSRFSQPMGPCFVAQGMTAWKDRFYASVTHFIVQRAGEFPDAEWVPYSQPEVVAQRVLEILSSGSGMCLNTAPSAAVKVSLAARASGATLKGLTFLLGAEPLTPARREAIEASGAVARPLYGSSEGGGLGGNARGRSIQTKFICWRTTTP